MAEAQAAAERVPAFGKALSLMLGMAVIGPLALVMTISFSAIVFSGPLADFLDRGIGIGLFGGLALGLIAALGCSYRGTIAQPQDLTAVILALSAFAIADRLAGGDPAVLFATVAVLIAVAGLAAGVAFLIVGVIRLGFLARFIPYPVLGGFLAATGYLIAKGAFAMLAATVPEGTSFLSAGALLRWGPPVLLGIAMLVVARRTGNGLALPLMLAAGFAAFYGLIALAGIDLVRAGEMGLLLGPFEASEQGWRGLTPAVLAQAEYREILVEAPAILTLVGLALVSAILNASGLELATGQRVDIDRDLRTLGVANLVTGAGGGLLGYHIISETLLARRLTGANTRWIGAGIAMLSAAVLYAGPQLLGMLPLGIFAAVLVYFGLDFLYEWLWVERRRLPFQDFAIVLIILLAAATIGFLQAVAVGILLASLMFLVNYARLDVIRSRLTGALRLSSTERADAAVHHLIERGAATRIYELQGYVFFGTANALYSQIAEEIARGGVRAVILDFRRVQGLDVSAVFNFGKLEQLCRAHGLRLILSDLSPGLRRSMDLAGLTAQAGVFPTLDDALAAVEDELLAGEVARAGVAGSGVADSGLGPLFTRAAGVVSTDLFPATRVAAGSAVIAQGTPSDSMILLEEGRLSATSAGPDGTEMKVATFLPGAVVGEIGFLAGTPRTATVRAETDSTIREVGRAGLDRLAEADPALARDIYRAAAALLARRLTRTTALLREVGR
jgi:sulfate permease, SulP family